MPSLNEYAEEIFTINREHGWHDGTRTFGEGIALIHSEASEALEEYRNGHAPSSVYFKYDIHGNLLSKPEGVPTELIDIIVRVLDVCGRYGIDADAVMRQKLDYNKTREFRHGGKVM